MIRAALVAALLALPAFAQEVAVAPQGAVVRALDKISGLTRDIELAPGETVAFGRITVTLSECRYPVDDPTADAFAHLVVRDPRLDEPLFEGWMIEASPALSALDHPRYDVWVLRCRVG